MRNLIRFIRDLRRGPDDLTALAKAAGVLREPTPEPVVEPNPGHEAAAAAFAEADATWDDLLPIHDEARAIVSALAELDAVETYEDFLYVTGEAS